MFFIARWYHAAKPIGVKLTWCQATPQVARAHKKWRSIKRGTLLVRGDSLRTPGRLTLAVPHQSTIRLDAHSVVRITRADTQDDKTLIALNLVQGRCWVDAVPGCEVTVTTKRGSARGNGSTMEVTAAPNSCHAAAWRGSVWCATPHTRPAAIHEGTEVSFSGDRLYSQSIETPDGFDLWNLNLTADAATRGSIASAGSPSRPLAEASTSYRRGRPRRATQSDPTSTVTDVQVPLETPAAPSAPVAMVPPPSGSTPPVPPSPPEVNQPGTPPGNPNTNPPPGNPNGNPPPGNPNGLVVGIVRIDMYPTSCVVWGYIYNDSPENTDMQPSFKLRDAEGYLCQPSHTQNGCDPYTISRHSMLYFWPGFTWEPPRGQNPLDMQTEVTKKLENFTVRVAGQRFTLPAVDNVTSDGPMNSLHGRLPDRIKSLLGSFPDNGIRGLN